MHYSVFWALIEPFHKISVARKGTRPLDFILRFFTALIEPPCKFLLRSPLQSNVHLCLPVSVTHWPLAFSTTQLPSLP